MYKIQVKCAMTKIIIIKKTKAVIVRTNFEFKYTELTHQ